MIIITLIILFFVIVIIAVIGLSISMWKQSQKDWDRYYDIEKRANQVKTKEEIELLHRELVEFGNKCNNSLINPKLQRIDGYLRGLYKQYQK